MPRSWKVKEDEDSYVVIEDRYDWFYLIAQSFIGEEEATIEDIADDMAQQFFNTHVWSSSQDEVRLAGGITAPRIKMILKTPLGYIGSQVVYIRLGHRGYVFFIYSNPNTQSVPDSKLQEFFSSVRLFMPELMGLDRSDTLVMLGGDPAPEDLDPALTLSGAGGYVGLLFSGLVRLSPTLEVVPDLAESWSISQDGRIYTFNLRPGIRFASGRPVTAQDFKDSWERAMDPQLGSATARAYLGDILGADEKAAGQVAQISGLKVLAADRLEVTLDGPKPYFLAKLAAPAAFVVDVSQTAPGSKDWRFAPNASGPYQLKEYRQDEGISFERNPNYYAAMPIPHVVSLFYSPALTPLLYDSDVLDIGPLRPVEAVLARQPGHEFHAAWHTLGGLCTQMILVDNTRPPFDDLGVRQAFSLALDKDALARRLSEGIDLPAGSPLPPAMPGFSSQTGGGFDPHAARQALQASPYAQNLPEIVLSAAGYGDATQADVDALVEMWRRNLGVEVKVEYLDPQNYSQALRQEHGQLVSFAWCADYPDPENVLDFLFHSQGALNLSGYSNPELDGLLEAARLELDPVQRLQRYQQAERLLLDQAGVIPLVYPVQHVLVNPRVQGFLPTPIQTMLMPWLSLEAEEKAP
jgi:ABC-type transport system substrate-binding protein